MGTSWTRAGRLAGLIVAVALGIAILGGAERASQAADLTLTLNYGVLGALPEPPPATGA